MPSASSHHLPCRFSRIKALDSRLAGLSSADSDAYEDLPAVAYMHCPHPCLYVAAGLRTCAQLDQWAGISESPGSEFE